MRRKLISSGSTFEAQIGYSRAVVQGARRIPVLTTLCGSLTCCPTPRSSRLDAAGGAAYALSGFNNNEEKP